MQHKGSCHCGSIHFEVAGPAINAAIQCNCSLCSKRSAKMSAFDVAATAISVFDPNKNLQSYQFGKHIARHFFCGNCGIYVFHHMYSKPGRARFNLACIDDTDVYALPVEIFNGANL